MATFAQPARRDKQRASIVRLHYRLRERFINRLPFLYVVLFSVLSCHCLHSCAWATRGRAAQIIFYSLIVLLVLFSDSLRGIGSFEQFVSETKFSDCLRHAVPDVFRAFTVIRHIQYCLLFGVINEVIQNIIQCAVTIRASVHVRVKFCMFYSNSTC